MTDKTRFVILTILLIASIVLLWFANSAANNVLIR